MYNRRERSSTLSHVHRLGEREVERESKMARGGRRMAKRRCRLQELSLDSSPNLLEFAGGCRKKFTRITHTPSWPASGSFRHQINHSVNNSDDFNQPLSFSING